MKSNFYILQQGTLIKKDNSLEFVNKEMTKMPIPIMQIDTIFILASIHISSDCLKLLANNGIVLHYFDYYTNYIGTFYPKITKTLNGELLVNQVLSFTDNKIRIYLAKQTIKASFKNMYKLVHYYEKRKIVNCCDFSNQYQICLNELNTCSSINQIMLIEASIHKAYYGVWNKFLNEDVGFEKRVKQNAFDIVNCLLTFLNSLLYSLIVSEIYKTGLNPTISFLHE
ncbi:MAG: CRISPR-associated endonuclease Cas1, partial [Christensenellales bacterium]